MKLDEARGEEAQTGFAGRQSRLATGKAVLPGIPAMRGPSSWHNICKWQPA